MSRSSKLPPSAPTQQLPELTQEPTGYPTVLAMGKLARAAGTRSASRPVATPLQNSPTYWARILIFMTPQINLKIYQGLIFTVLRIHKPLDLIDFQNYSLWYHEPINSLIYGFSKLILMVLQM